MIEKGPTVPIIVKDIRVAIMQRAHGHHGGDI